MKLFQIYLWVFVLFCTYPALCIAQQPSRDYTNAVLWQQRSGEYRALCFQAYNAARFSLDQKLKRVDSRPKAVIVDIDETVLDNSPSSGEDILRNRSFSLDEWKRWTGLAQADTVPGAPSFLKYAASVGLEVFYVSNRDPSEMDATIKNLRYFDLPDADTAHILLRSDVSNKERRRNLVSETHEVLLLVGDNLSDFSTVFYQEGKETFDEVNRLGFLFGVSFIVLPNPMYGDWEQELYEGKRNLTDEEKAEMRKKKIIGF
ncbi:5'-nucleotidase, lipoprotein e(P4) family [Olivibacter sitiensis]|uniref:5'-nucleotidase, lipoprotein e(P4) family n=1 Tax=Olivibacter sitiensis TaxID=376470 RepID=UPI0004045BBA|nr:5'-nucleotidase, lipoprotein e(P4) family [Olivibacter sitiensis]